MLENKSILKKWVKDLILLTLGCAMMATGTALFLLPNKLSSGGFTGIATIIYYLFKIPLGRTMIILNTPLFIMTFIRVGKESAIKGLIGTFILSNFIDLLDKITPVTDDKFLACIYGGILIGIGSAIILKAHASTGGSDLLSYVIRSYNSKFKSGNLIVITDIIIVLLNVIVFKEIEIGLYSAIAIYIMGKMIDIIFEGVYFTKNIFIVSSKYEEIAKEISDKIERGLTGIYAKGMYTNDEKMMLWCVASRNEVVRIKEIAKKIDKNSFIVISNAREALGKGFK